MQENRETYFEHANRLESLAHQLLTAEFDGAQGLWKLERSLIEHQIEIQGHYSRLKGEIATINGEIKGLVSGKPTGWDGQVVALQGQKRLLIEQRAVYKRLKALSRRIGDALAWVFFDFRERHLSPLTENMATAHIPRGDGLKGMLAIAEAMASAGLGFPLIHDMTSILGNGDVSFIVPGEKPLTVEIKTKVIERLGDTTRAQITMFAAPNEDQRKRLEKVKLSLSRKAHDVREGSTKRAKMRRGDDRWRRQLKRLRKAGRLQDAEPLTIFEQDGDRRIIVEMEPSVAPLHHWQIAGDVAMEARTHGYASRAVDEAFLYVAIYAPDVLSYPWGWTPSDLPNLNRVPTDLVESGILLSDERHLNGLWMLGSQERERMSRPFLVQPLPLDVALDLTFGRMMFLVLVNPGRVAKALEEAGLDAVLEYGQEPINRDFIRVRHRGEMNGTQYSCEVRNLAYHARRFGTEFLSLGGFVEIAKAMVTQAGKVAGIRFS